MNDNHIEIKERRSSLIAKGIIFLFLSVFSLTITLLPYLVHEFKEKATAFYLGGGITFCCFATIFVFLLFKECKPDSIIILNSRGFKDFKNVGANVEIEWTNVASIKLMGKKETPYLGITLENADIVMAHMKKPYAEDMRENIEEGLPHILLSQRDIRYPINELKELFVKFTREARALKNDIPSKPKNNPFTTEDVLRAFGKLDTIEEEKEASENKEDESPINCNETISEEPNKISYTESLDKENNSNKNENISIDSFYETLLKQSETLIRPAQNENATTTVENNEQVSFILQNEESNDEKSNNDLSNEFEELMSKARSAKIAEIEKMLNENDVPYSTLRETRSSVEEVAPLPEKAQEQKNDSLNITENNSSNGVPKAESHSDAKESYPEIIHFDDL